MSFDLPRTARDLRFSGGAISFNQPTPEPQRAPQPAPTVRKRFDTVDDLAETCAIDRDALGLAPAFDRGLVLTQRQPKHAALGVPNFRRTAAPPEPAIVYVPPLEARRSRSRSSSALLSFFVWGCLALLGGTTSYRYMPDVVDDVMSAVRVLSAR